MLLICAVDRVTHLRHCTSLPHDTYTFSGPRHLPAEGTTRPWGTALGTMRRGRGTSGDPGWVPAAGQWSELWVCRDGGRLHAESGGKRQGGGNLTTCSCRLPIHFAMKPKTVDTLHLQFHRRKRQQVRNAQAPCQCTYFSPGFSGERSLDAHQLFVPEKWCPQRTIPQEPDLSPTQAQQTLKINKIVAGGVRWTRGDTSGSEPAAGAMHRYHKLPWWWSPGGCVRWHCM